MSFLRRIFLISTTAFGVGMLSSLGLKACAQTTDAITVNGNVPSTLIIDITETTADLTTNIAAATPDTYRVKLSDIANLGNNNANGYTVSFTAPAAFASVSGDDTINYGLAIAPSNTADLSTLTYATTGTVHAGPQGNVSDQALFIELTQLDSDTADAGNYTLNLSLTVADQ